MNTDSVGVATLLNLDPSSLQLFIPDRHFTESLCVFVSAFDKLLTNFLHKLVLFLFNTRIYISGCPGPS